MPRLKIHNVVLYTCILDGEIKNGIVRNANNFLIFSFSDFNHHSSDIYVLNNGMISIEFVISAINLIALSLLIFQDTVK
jgi:hypothetical protein